MLDTVLASLQLPDVRRRILVTIAIMVVFVSVTNIPIPGVPYEIRPNLSTDIEAVFDMLDITAGNALTPFSIVAIGIPSVIFSQFLLQWVLIAFYGFESVLNGNYTTEGINTHRILYIINIPVALILGHLLIWILYGTNILLLEKYVTVEVKLLVGVTRGIALIAGALFTLWLIDINNYEGLSENGLDILIFAGSVSILPVELSDLLNEGNIYAIFGTIAIALFTIVFLISLKEGQRLIAVQYGRRVRDRKIFQGQSTHIPLRVLPASPDLIKVLLVSLLYILLPIYAISQVSSGWLHEVTQSLYTFLRLDRLPIYLLTAAFLPFYLSINSEIEIRKQRLTETLQRQGAFIPGVRPGRLTEQYILSIARRIFVPASIALSLVFMANIYFAYLIDTSIADVFLWWSIISIVLNIMRQFEATLLFRHYEGFIRSESNSSK